MTQDNLYKHVTSLKVSSFMLLRGELINTEQCKCSRCIWLILDFRAPKYFPSNKGNNQGQNSGAEIVFLSIGSQQVLRVW